MNNTHRRTGSVPTTGHWHHVARLWELVGPPLRPSREDVEYAGSVVRDWTARHHAPRALILGVTPELYRLPWPPGTQILALDHTRAMIEAIWPGRRDEVTCADWTALPLADGSRDIVLCDGGFHLLAHPAGQRAMVRDLGRVLAPGGLCILRLFVPPSLREDPETVLAALVEGRIGNLNLLKLRLGMALQQDESAGVVLRDVWDAVHRTAPDFERLAAQIGWPLEHLLAVDTYRDSETRYHFVDVGRVRELFCEDPGGFQPESSFEPGYELGERCPTIVLRRMAVPC